ncbi:MAG: hypothetical protein RJA22_2530 [Verrucomicrobiota bacterium]
MFTCVLLAGSIRPLGSCGPDFPNWVLADPLATALAAPSARFEEQVRRLQLVPTRRQAHHSGSGLQPGGWDKDTFSHSRATVEAEMADLGRALERTMLAGPDRERILAAHRVERLKLGEAAPGPAGRKDATPGGWANDRLRPSPDHGPRVSPGSVPQVTPGLPGEFADYLRGAVAWHQGDLAGARAAWAQLLRRPPTERRYKSTWAAYMLGRSWEEEDRDRALGFLRQVRALADAGYADSCGLAVASLGYEARLLCRAARLPEATDLYLEQAAAGEPTAFLSLRYVARQAMEGPSRRLTAMARHPRAQRLVTAYVLACGHALAEIDVDGPIKERSLQLWKAAAGKLSVVPAPPAGWHTLELPARRWLEAVEEAGVKDVAAAEDLALACYQVGEMDRARRWLARAPSTPVTQWLEAKLLLRDGKLEEASALLAAVARHFPVTPGSTNRPAPPGLAGELQVYMREDENASMGEAVRANLAVAQMARRQFIEALDALLHSAKGYWMDAAYVAERVLTLEELQAYVDRTWPASTTRTAPHPDPATRDEKVLLAGARQAQEEFGSADRIRHLLGRRLARAGQWEQARRYFPAAWQPLLARFLAARQTAGPPGRDAQEQALGLLETARLLRRHGMELIGTEVEPDWRVYSGDFEAGVSVEVRTAMLTNGIPSTGEELRRAKAHGVQPEERWHYRAVGRATAHEAARRLRGAVLPGQSPADRARVLFAAAQFAQTNGMGFSESGRTTTARPSLGAEADFLWQAGYSAASLAWEAARLLPDNTDETARILYEAGRWIRSDPAAADLFYKSLVRRCGRTALGAAADRARWFPKPPKAPELETPAPEATP